MFGWVGGWWRRAGYEEAGDPFADDEAGELLDLHCEETDCPGTDDAGVDWFCESGVLACRWCGMEL